ncbi:hypothetical protein OKW42_004712 [Paraburkholderia sp. WC7.3d]|nr:hypothetical protein [Paraburkholderia podalyriae]
MVFVGARGDQQDADALARQVLRQRRRIAQTIELTLDPAKLRKIADQRVVQRFPRPRKHCGIVAGNDQMQLCMTCAGPLAVEIARLAGIKQFDERFRAPAAQLPGHPLGPLLVRAERIVQVLLQIPGQLLAQCQLRVAQHPPQRIGKLHGGRCLDSRGTHPLHAEPVPFAARFVADD